MTVETGKRHADQLLEELVEFIEEQEIEELNLHEASEEGIKDPKQADYFVKKVKELEAYKEATNETARQAIEDYKDKVERWRQQEVESLERSIEYFSELLQSFARQQLEGSSKKSLKLIEGTVGFKAQPPKIEYDDKVLVEFLEKNKPEYVRYTPAPKKDELKKKAEIKDGRLFLDGKPVEGVIAEEREDKFYVK